jgi:hypothetical protein
MACETGPQLEQYNELPIADAKALKNGMPVEQMRDGSLADLIFPYDGMPVAITLDGASSFDPDGKITAYHWLSGTRIPDAGLPPPWTPDAGPPLPFLRKPPPDGALTGASPTITLGPGVWAFSLWVKDDRGSWSSPDTIRLIVGDPPPVPRDGGVAGDGGMLPDAGGATDAGLAADAGSAVDAGAVDAGADDGSAAMDAAADTGNGSDAAPDA